LAFATSQDMAMLKSNQSGLVDFELKRAMIFVARFVRFRENKCVKLWGTVVAESRLARR